MTPGHAVSCAAIRRKDLKPGEVEADLVRKTSTPRSSPTNSSRRLQMSMCSSMRPTTTWHHTHQHFVEGCATNATSLGIDALVRDLIEGEGGGGTSLAMLATKT